MDRQLPIKLLVGIYMFPRMRRTACEHTAYITHLSLAISSIHFLLLNFTLRIRPWRRRKKKFSHFLWNSMLQCEHRTSFGQQRTTLSKSFGGDFLSSLKSETRMMTVNAEILSTGIQIRKRSVNFFSFFTHRRVDYRLK